MDFNYFSGFLELKSASTLFWTSVFVVCDAGKLRVYDNESENKCLFEVNLDAHFSVEALSPEGKRECIFELKEIRGKSIRSMPAVKENSASSSKEADKRASRSSFTELADSLNESLNSFTTTVTTTFTQFTNIMQGGKLTLSVHDKSVMETWMIVLIQSINGNTMRESESFEGRVSIAGTGAVGNTLSKNSQDPSSGTANLAKAVSDSTPSEAVDDSNMEVLISGPLKLFNPSSTLDALGNLLDTEAIVKENKSWTEHWFELSVNKTRGTLRYYDWKSPMYRHARLNGHKSADAGLDSRYNEIKTELSLQVANNNKIKAKANVFNRIAALNGGGSSKSTGGTGNDGADGEKEGEGEREGGAASLHVEDLDVNELEKCAYPGHFSPSSGCPWISPNAFYNSGQTELVGEEREAVDRYVALWSTVDGFDSTANMLKTAPSLPANSQARAYIPRPPAHTFKGSIDVTTNSKVMLLPPTLGTTGGFALITPFADHTEPGMSSKEGNLSLRMAIDTESTVEGEVAWLAYLEQTLMVAKQLESPSTAFSKNNLRSYTGNVTSTSVNVATEDGSRMVGFSISMTRNQVKQFLIERDLEPEWKKKGEKGRRTSLMPTLPQVHQDLKGAEKGPVRTAKYKPPEGTVARTVEEESSSSSSGSGNSGSNRAVEIETPSLPPAMDLNLTRLPGQEGPGSLPAAKSTDSSETEDTSTRESVVESPYANAPKARRRSVLETLQDATAPLTRRASNFIAKVRGTDSNPEVAESIRRERAGVHSQFVTLEVANQYYRDYFARPAKGAEVAAHRSAELVVRVYENQRFVPVRGFSRQHLFIVSDPPALSDVTGQCKFPYIVLENAQPPSGYRWKTGSVLGVPQGWCHDSNPKSLGILSNIGLTPEQIEVRNRKLALQKGAQLLTTKGVQDIESSNDDLEDSDDEDNGKGKKKDSWSGRIEDWADGWVYGHSFSRFEVHAQTGKYHFGPGTKDVVRRRLMVRTCELIE